MTKVSPPAGQKPATNPAAPQGLDPLSALAEWLTPGRVNRIAWALIALGIVVRSIRYLLCFPLWPDESYLARNFLDRGYLGLLAPLQYIQIAPPLYLWAQKTLILALGFSEYTLRLLPLACGITSLLVFRHMAGRLLRGGALLLAVGLFAVSYPLIRYSAEAKPYGSDLLVSLVLLAMAVEWGLSPRRRRWLWALVAVMPLAILMSFPAIFVAGGISLAMAVAMAFPQKGDISDFQAGERAEASQRPTFSRRDWLLWCALNLTILASVGVLFGCSAHRVMTASGGPQRAAFATAFPPLTSPKDLAVYLLESHSGDAMAYPLGGKHGASALTTLCCLTGLVLLVRGRRFYAVSLGVAPMALHFAAAALHGYPYGNHARFFLYLGPVFCLAMGLGGAKLISLLKPRRRPAWTPLAIAMVILVAVAAGASVRDFLKPYKDPCLMRDRDFARWFWIDKAWNAELVCVESDLNKRFYEPPDGDDLSSIYLCNQRIYSPRLARGEPPRFDRVSKTWPLRCARFRPTCTTPRDDADFREWLRSMESRYELVGQEKYPLSFWIKQDLVCVDQVELYEFIPRESGGTAALDATVR